MSTDETSVRTKYGMMSRAVLLVSSGVQETADSRVEWTEYRAVGTMELVRRDCHVVLKKGLQIGAAFHMQPAQEALHG